MNYLKLLVGGSTNSYIVYNDQKMGVIIDPGADSQKIIQASEKLELDVEGILLTHAHGDHIGALNQVREYFNVEVYLHEDEKIIYENTSYNMAPLLGLESPNKPADHYFKDNDTIKFKTGNFKVLHTPGHTPGSSCFLIETLLFTGDTLFQGSIGRTDLPMGNWKNMEISLKKVKNLQDDLIVLSGHGDVTSIKIEKKNNPFLMQIL